MLGRELSHDAGRVVRTVVVHQHDFDDPHSVSVRREEGIDQSFQLGHERREMLLSLVNRDDHRDVMLGDDKVGQTHRERIRVRSPTRPGSPFRHP
jgi:hypothetical protein